MSVFDRHLESMIVRQSGRNHSLAKEIIEKISDQGKERLFRIFQEIESEKIRLEKKSKMPWI